jgi:hypothetical protein
MKDPIFLNLVHTIEREENWMKATTRRKLADKFGRGMFAIFLYLDHTNKGLNDHVDVSRRGNFGGFDT